MEKEIDKFASHAINHHKYTEEGDWKKGNAEIKKINKVYNIIKGGGTEAKKELLKLIHSDKTEVAALAATYSMTFSPEECIAVLKDLSQKNLPHVSFASKQAIENWNNNEWYID
ncbi:hypothetical protein LVD17_03040 [Fulvivirga ulvae]|uniref:hypothetical protein n=1 Tax=Fulvivirga ulvae TaxID=2904245 RepID=UPI001F1EAE0D|nr:hypothetical protein [Fulvivirga ulvae]UII32807.1 hypothetical protein LVD17_03040 [Fulvivirga ulvae]